jgi:tetratricopeptide (TPR) repeat protein
MYRRYVPVPIVSEGIRLDTVIRADEEFVYLYRETLPARDGRKKAKLSVSGKIFELNKAIYTIPPTDTLTYYISSLTAFIDKSLNPHDAKYRDGLAALRSRDYKRAVTLLQSYQDINTALAYLEMDYNGTARIILENLPDSENVIYLKAVVYARTGREEQAQTAFLKACELKPSFWHRGNLDPEISWLVKHYQLDSSAQRASE